MIIRQKAITVDAVQWTGENIEEIAEFVGNRFWYQDDDAIVITRDSCVQFYTNNSDWLVKLGNGLIFAYPKCVFEQLYVI
jgi:hypothetical protein